MDITIDNGVEIWENFIRYCESIFDEYDVIRIYIYLTFIHFILLNI